MDISAKEMAKRLRNLSSQLAEMGVVESDAVYAIGKAATQLDSFRYATDWRYEIDKSNPIVFKPIDHKRFGRVQMILTSQLSYSNSGRDNRSGGFNLLNITFECVDDSAQMIGRWHIDLANVTNGDDDDEEAQEGPLFHLQFGGHSSGTSERSGEYQMERPRWMHPPMDLVLACEMVVANFFPDDWKVVCEFPEWFGLIRDSEDLCLEPYHQMILNHLSRAGLKSTLLRASWCT